MVKVAGSKRGNSARQLECLRMSKLKGWRIVEFGGLSADRLDDRSSVVTRMAAPNTRGPVEYAPSARREIVHSPRTNNEPWILFECTIGRVPKPIRLQIGGHTLGSFTSVGEPHR